MYCNYQDSYARCLRLQLPFQLSLQFVKISGENILTYKVFPFRFPPQTPQKSLNPVVPPPTLLVSLQNRLTNVLCTGHRQGPVHYRQQGTPPTLSLQLMCRPNIRPISGL